MAGLGNAILVVVILVAVSPGALMEQDSSDSSARSSEKSATTSQKSSAELEENHLCNGHGNSWCGDAHEEQECPPGCNPWECEEESSDMNDKSRDIVMTGKYDYVYYDPDYNTVCVSYCWRRWDDMKCKEGKSETER